VNSDKSPGGFARRFRAASGMVLVGWCAGCGACGPHSHIVAPGSICETMVFLSYYSACQIPCGGRTFQVYRMGSRPPLLILHELPGLSHQTLEFGKRVARVEFTVYLPVLFGKPVSSSDVGGLRTLYTTPSEYDIARATPSPANPPATVQQAAARLLAALSTVSAETNSALFALKSALPELATQKGATLLKEYVQAANVELNNLVKWFNSVEDRSLQWAALLSLGAPFWFNTLKSLATPKQIMANEVDKDPRQLPATPPAGKR